jgi:hypothetical protein
MVPLGRCGRRFLGNHQLVADRHGSQLGGPAAETVSRLSPFLGAMKLSSGADDVLFGTILILGGSLNVIFYRALTRVFARFYGRWNKAMPWLYPEPFRAMTREPFLRWLLIAQGVIVIAVGIGMVVFGLFMA